jgi:hypothetical protein
MYPKNSILITYYIMNRVILENALRPLYQNVGIVGSRGPVPSWVFPSTLAVVFLLTMILILMIGIYEMMSTGKCIMCGKKH